MPEGFVYATEGGAIELQVEISLTGPEHSKNRELAREVSSYLNDLSSKAKRPWISQSVLNFQAPSPMIAYHLFPDRLQKYGLDSSTVSQKLRWALYGPVSLKWQTSDSSQSQSELDVRIMGTKAQYSSYQDIRRSGLLNNQRKCTEGKRVKLRILICAICAKKQGLGRNVCSKPTQAGKRQGRKQSFSNWQYGSFASLSHITGKKAFHMTKV